MITDFPRIRTRVGTLVSVGFTPQADNQAYQGFATFENNGRLESYKVSNVPDFKYLLHIMGQSPSVDYIFNRSLQRRDLAIEHFPNASHQTNSIMAYDIDGAAFVPIEYPPMTLPAQLASVMVPALDEA